MILILLSCEGALIQGTANLSADGAIVQVARLPMAATGSSTLQIHRRIYIALPSTIVAGRFGVREYRRTGAAQIQNWRRHAQVPNPSRLLPRFAHEALKLEDKL